MAFTRSLLRIISYRVSENPRKKLLLPPLLSPPFHLFQNPEGDTDNLFVTGSHDSRCPCPPGTGPDTHTQQMRYCWLGCRAFPPLSFTVWLHKCSQGMGPFSDNWGFCSLSVVSIPHVVRELNHRLSEDVLKLPSFGMGFASCCVSVSEVILSSRKWRDALQCEEILCSRSTPFRSEPGLSSGERLNTALVFHVDSESGNYKIYFHVSSASHVFSINGCFHFSLTFLFSN